VDGRITQFTSVLDGTVDYTHDATGQLTGADYDYQDDESYTYDAGGNRTGGGYVVGTNNQMISDGTYHYLYDAEGNRTHRFVDDGDGQLGAGDSDITEYEWDHRNRLVRVIERETETGPAVKVVEHTYDYLNRWVGRAVDPDGDGALEFEDTYFVYDGTPEGVSVLDRGAVTMDNIGQILLQFQDDAQGDPQLAHRYLWGPAVDQILADEQVTSLTSPGDVLWPLADHLGTVRDLAQHDAGTGTTTVANHRVFNAFGELTSETNVAIDHLFAFTGRALDESTGLQNNLNRWYDAEVGRWLSQDPIGFDAGDANLYRYVGNDSLSVTDPSGLQEGTFWRRIGTFLSLITDDGRHGTRLQLPKEPKGDWRLRQFFHSPSFQTDDPRALRLIYQTRFGCGGLAAWRAGCTPDPDVDRFIPRDISRLPGAKRYPTLQDAVNALSESPEWGLIIAVQMDEHGTPLNYATLLGSDREPYWEYANHGWKTDPETARIKHRPTLPGGFDKVEFIFVPGDVARFLSPIPPGYSPSAF
jgi:RHS repeat-associated protein